MKTHFSIFVLLCLSTILCQAQDKKLVENNTHRNQDLGTPNTLKIIGTDNMNISDENGELQGKWKRTHEDGSFKCQGVYKDGYKMGYWERKWPNGNWMYQMNMHNGYRNGYCKFFYENGNLEKEGNYIMGKEDGIIKSYYENAQKKAEETYSDGKLNGLSMYFDEVGFMTMKGEFFNNERDGDWYFYSKKTAKLSSQITIIKYDKGNALSTKISSN